LALAGWRSPRVGAAARLPDSGKRDFEGGRELTILLTKFDKRLLTRRRAFERARGLTILLTGLSKRSPTPWRSFERRGGLTILVTVAPVGATPATSRRGSAPATSSIIKMSGRVTPIQMGVRTAGSLIFLCDRYMRRLERLVSESRNRAKNV
jgi:hypothetical protein